VKERIIFKHFFVFVEFFFFVQLLVTNVQRMIIGILFLILAPWIFPGDCVLSSTVANNSELNNTVTMISVHIGNNLLYGYYVAHPVYDVAVRQIRQLYPTSLGNMEYVNIYLPGYDLCQDGGDKTARFFAEFYFENPRIFRSAKVFPVIFSPGKYFVQRLADKYRGCSDNAGTLFIFGYSND
jgi:hypothetical protein